MRKIIVTIALSIMFAAATIKSAGARHSPYVLDILKTKDPDFEKVRLRHQGSGRILWTRTVSHRRDTYWSTDHRAVAVETTNYILVWRAGQRLMTVEFSGGHRLGDPQGDYDYSLGYLWSPDRRRLLVRFGASGSADMNAAPLYCIGLGQGRYKCLTPPIQDLVWKMAWRGNRSVVYWLFDYNRQIPLQKPHLWRVP